MLDDVTGKMPGNSRELKCPCGVVAESSVAMARHKRDCPVDRLRRVGVIGQVKAPATLGRSELPAAAAIPVAPMPATQEPGSAPISLPQPSRHEPLAVTATVEDGGGKVDPVPALGRGRMICPSCGAVKGSHGACKACGEQCKARRVAPAADPHAPSTWARIVELRAALAALESKFKNHYAPMPCYDMAGGNSYSRLDK